MGRRPQRRDRDAAEAARIGLTNLLTRYGDETLLADHRATDHYRLGDAARHIGEFPAAVASLTRAIQKNPDYEVAYVDRAVAYSRMGDLKPVVEDASKALSLNGAARRALAVQQAARHPRDTLGRQEDTRTARNLDAWEATARRARGFSYLALNQVHLALQDGQRLTALEPKSPWGYQILGLARLRLGNTDLARKHLERAVQLERDPVLREAILRQLKALEGRP